MRPVSVAHIPSVTAVVLAFGADPWLERSVDAILSSDGIDIDVVVVHNGGADPTRLHGVEGRSGVRLLEPGRNLGFAAGCNAGAAVATGDVLVFVNQDAVVDGTTLASLARVALRPGVGLATGSVRLAEAADTINSAGNVVHFLGFSWAGGFGWPAVAFAEEREVAAASGTALAVARSLWEDLGGFAEPYFAYYEDTELSFRCWQRGLTVMYVPSAVVTHRYEFSRNARKYYLLDRNRLVFLLTLFEGRTLILLAPALVLAEAAVLALALRGGWLRAKFAGWAWLVRNGRWVSERRRLLQRERVHSDRDLARLLVGHLEPGNFALPRGTGFFDRLLAGYWRAIGPLLRRSPGRHP